eukprot:1194690-Prorocentrum_minimum.AAC.2
MHAPGNPGCSQRWQHPRFGCLCPSCTAQHTLKMPLFFKPPNRRIRPLLTPSGPLQVEVPEWPEKPKKENPTPVPKATPGPVPKLAGSAGESPLPPPPPPHYVLTKPHYVLTTSSLNLTKPYYVLS